MGVPSFFLGIETVLLSGGVLLSQQRYMKDILKRASMVDCKPVITHVSSAKITDDVAVPYADPTQYRSFAGALQYLTVTRPDLSYAVNLLCQHIHAPTTTDWTYLKRVLRYVKGTLNLGLRISRSTSMDIHDYSDSDWAGDPNDHKSTSGFAVFLGSNLISWVCRKQRTVARSSTEAKYKELADVSAEVTWLVSLLHEIGIPPASPPRLRLPIINPVPFFIFVFMVTEFGFCCGNPNPICRKDEKQALLCFKKGLKDPSSRLWSWVDIDGDYDDCCSKWSGVVCNNVSGHVTELHLANPGNGSSAFGGELSPCLLELKQLSHLDLSGNDFEGIPIPGFLGSLLNLEYLDLADAGFQGIIPHQLGNLTGLHTLTIRGPAYSSPISSGFLEISLGMGQRTTTSLSDYSLGGLKVDSLEWLSSLSNLQRLDLSYVDLSNAPNWVEVTSALPSLHHLRFSGCSLANISSSLHHHNYSSILVLHLSQNSFNSFVPKWIFNLHSLVSLDLSDSSFLGPLPETGPWNFSSLETLDISLNRLSGSLPSHGNLPKLKILRTTLNMFNSSLPQWIFRCSELQTLDLQGNRFSGPVHGSVGKMKRLRYLDLNGNDFRSSIPSWIYECTELSYLDLSYNRFQGTISHSISNLTSLVFFSVSNNRMLSGEVPKQIGKLCKLVSLSLSANKFSGLISELFQSMSECVFDGLVKLLLYDNQFSGPMFDTSLKFPSLSTLDLGGNKMNGTLPERLGNMFPMLDFLDVSNNILQGVVTENHFVNLKELWTFYASGNRLTLKVSPNWLPPFKLSNLGLGSWHLGPQFPVWLQSQKEISEVDISNAGIKDEVPTWLWNLSSQLSVLNLSHNQFSGRLPRNTFPITKLDLSDNLFSGDVIGFFCHPQNESIMLNRLHLRRNALSGQIPDCLGNWPVLEVLDLAENSLSGRIPKTIGLLKLLSSLDLNGNKLSGNIPSSLQNCTGLEKLDLGENELEGNTANWLVSSLSSLFVLRLRSNGFYGELPPDFCHLKSLQILDLANNNFTGIIPRCLNNFTSMVEPHEIDFDIDRETEILLGESATVITKGQEYQYSTIILVLATSFDLSNNNFSGEIPVELTTLVELRFLNLSGNKLTGNIPKNIGDMKQLESIDLSRNHLSGEIPYSLSNLNFLSYLNLSYNNLSGKIPTGTQLQSFNASCYVGNNLCGPPLFECSNESNDDDAVPDEEEDRGDDSDEAKWFYISMAIGFVVGWCGIWGPLFVVKSWRQAYFQFLDVKLKYPFGWFGL
ncbi:PREDICTED: LRR receptor-like serine/threonine-protein kinase GSO1 [Ipomoea nil]|uniref:LRR receptor-like serine/threonine-protein kinase GSO1 n=1 Tax=Ipomoea nil TaxID=35883 RepID=UPI000900F50E|nr:PREDICTED: LRR receptor-like serine/threonine-protein kinase GSO1 [Ipomoea nil]